MRKAPQAHRHGAPVEAHFERLEANNYFEYGLTDRITIGGKAFYAKSRLIRGDQLERAAGLSDLEGFFQYRLFRRGANVGAAKISVAAPASFQSGARPELASDGVDLEGAFLYGRNLTLRPVKLFLATEFGYRKRFSEATDQLRAITAFGVEPSDHWVAMVETFSVKSIGNSENADFDVFKIQPSLMWRANRRFAIQIGLNEEIAGRNLTLGRTVFLGLWTSF